ncbi:hemin uptake protein HemP [Proteus mirabilis]
MYQLRQTKTGKLILTK